MVEIWFCDLDELSDQALESLLFDTYHTDPTSTAIQSVEKQLHRMIGRKIVMQRTGCSLTDFTYTEKGKPFVPNQLHFSIAHDANLVVVAFASSELGIDVQRISSRVWNGVISRFHPLEQAALASSLEEEHQALFYRIWTRKEAFLKAIGDGITIELSSFNVLQDTCFHVHQEWRIFSSAKFEDFSCSWCIAAQENEEVKFIQFRFS